MLNGIRGKAYGVGVGPGDPELMTLKAIRLIRENDVIAVPGRSAKNSAAYRIAAAAVPEMAEKELLPLQMSMVMDRNLLREEHEEAARRIEKYLEQGRNVVCLTLGDPSIYSTFSYLQHILEADGYVVELVSGITSFCAAAARLNIPLAEWDQQLHVIPASHKTTDRLNMPGTCILMKTAGHMKETKEMLRKSGRPVLSVENCGMDTERVFHSAEAIPDDAGYFTLIIAKENRSSEG